MVKRLDRSIKLAINKQIKNDRDLNSQARLIIEKQFRVIKQKMLSEFESHPVTRELKAGSASSNITNSLDEGNLYGFIGFEAGSDPTEDIFFLLQKTNIFIKKRMMGRMGFIWTYMITSPSLRDLYKVTPMPWAKGYSWLQELEGRGIPNIGQYMYKQINSSRSQAGFQSKNRSSGGSLKIPYVKKMLLDFENKLNAIEASRVSAKNF
jgi:hypothetical protein